MPPSISIIATIKNEGDSLRPLLDSLIQQTHPPHEIVICDGGSTDNTLAVLHQYKDHLPLKIISLPGSNISQGRNHAVATATGPIIAATDAGVTLGPTWLEDITRPIRHNQAPVVSGWFESDPHTDFEVAMGATVLPDLDDINPQTFLPSSRSIAFLKSSWQAVNGYPEWLDYSEDLLFDLALRHQHGPFPFAPTAIAYFRPRQNLRAFFNQYYRYARGDGKANLWPKRHLLRYLIYLVGLPFLLRLIWQGKPLGWLGLLLGGGVYCSRPGQRLWHNTHGWRPPSRLRALSLIPLIRLIGDLAKMLGYPIGLLWRWQNKKERPETRG